MKKELIREITCLLNNLDIRKLNIVKAFLQSFNK